MHVRMLSCKNGAIMSSLFFFFLPPWIFQEKLVSIYTLAIYGVKIPSQNQINKNEKQKYDQHNNHLKCF